MSATHHPDLDDPRFSEVEAAIVAWRDVTHAQRRRVAVVLALALLAIFVVTGAVL
jgi:hypothetical protein